MEKGWRVTILEKLGSKVKWGRQGWWGLLHVIAGDQPEWKHAFDVDNISRRDILMKSRCS